MHIHMQNNLLSTLLHTTHVMLSDMCTRIHTQKHAYTHTKKNLLSIFLDMAHVMAACSAASNVADDAHELVLRLVVHL